MGAKDPHAADRRRQQAELYGEPFDALAARIQQTVGLAPPDIARTIGVSFPMFNEVYAGRRVKIGNPVAIARLRMLRAFTEHLETGIADPRDIELTLAQIRATNTASPQPAEGSPGTTARTAPHAAIPDPDSAPSASPDDLLTTARLDSARLLVRAHVRPTPTRRWPLLDELVGTEVWVKHENNNPTGAFKVRGGLTYLARLKAEQPGLRGVVTATRGNHGQSLAYAGRVHDVPVTIVVPTGNSRDKNAAMEAYGADLVVHGHDFQAAVEHAKELAAERQLVMVPSFHRSLVEGVATYAAELHESVPDLDVIYVPVGLGSGICANIAVRDLLGRRTEIVGVVSELAPAYAMSFDAGAPVSTGTADTFVDGVAVRKPDRDAVKIIKKGAARIVQVSEAEAGRAMVEMYRRTHNLPEPAGALALAGLLQEREEMAGKKVAVIHTGGNCDFDILQRVMAEFG